MKAVPATDGGLLITTAIPQLASPNPLDLIDAIGSDRFAPRLLMLLHENCGADHCTVYQVGENSLREIAAESLGGTPEAREQVARYLDEQYWRKDPTIEQAWRCTQQPEPFLIQVKLDRLDPQFRAAIYPHVDARLLICGRRENVAIGLSILRSKGHGVFSDAAIDKLTGMANLLICVIAKHANILLHRPNLALALSSLPEIEHCIAGKMGLPRREAQVSARILYGISSTGIALDLGISEESVKTYRKRAYERLRIGSERELLKIYLGLWGAFHADHQGIST